MTVDDYTRTLNELDRLLNDPDVPLQPDLIWQILDKVLERDVVPPLIIAMVDQKGDQMQALIGA